MPAKGQRHSPEALKKMREAKLGTKNPFFGKHWTEEAKAKFILSRSWYKHSQETRNKLSAAKILYYKRHPDVIESYKGKNNPMFGKTGVLSPMFGKHLPDEARKKLSEGRIGRFTGASNSFFGRHHTDETRQKMREKWRERRVFPEKDTSIELKLQQQLTAKHITFQKQAKIWGRPDIFIVPNICIFVDGCYWHGCPCKFNQDWTGAHAEYIKTRITHDVEITKKLTESGFVVLRFREHEINQNANKCLETIMGHLILNEMN